MNRRRFINALLRTGILGAFAILTGVFVAKGKITRDSECIADFQCRGCRKLKACRLPESENFRKDGKK